jgi:hypothetical protein
VDTCYPLDPGRWVFFFPEGRPTLLFLRACLILVYWVNSIPHFLPNPCVFSQISNTLPLPSGLGIEVLGDWRKLDGDISSNIELHAVPAKHFSDMASH